jgi:hypothetical protein
MQGTLLGPCPPREVIKTGRCPSQSRHESEPSASDAALATIAPHPTSRGGRLMTSLLGLLPPHTRPFRAPTQDK